MASSTKVYIKDWLLFQPYEKPNRSDFFYLRLCQDVHKILQYPAYEDFTDSFETGEISRLACFLTAWFEDIISETGMWASFIHKHHELYGKYLPFYAIGEDYVPEEINPEDIYFLLWYFSSHVFREVLLFSPFDPDIKPLGDAIFKLFDLYYDTAPENEDLQKFLNIQEDEENLYFIRFRMEWLIMDSYLFHFYRGELNEEVQELIEEASQSEHLADNIEELIHELVDIRTFSQTTALLAMKGKDWLAAILGKNHKLYQPVSEIGERKKGMFLYQGHDEKYVFLEHIASGKQLNITRKSLNIQSNFKKGESILNISLVKWLDEWWFSGIFIMSDYDAKVVRDEKDNYMKIGLFEQDSSKIKEAFDIQQKTFMEYNNNSPLKLLPNGEAVKVFLEGYIEYYYESLNHNNVEKEQKEGLGNKSIVEETEAALVFFNPHRGVETLFGHNALFDKKEQEALNMDEDDLEKMGYTLLMEREASPGLIKYLAAHTDAPFLKFDMEEPGENLFRGHLDFMLRFIYAERYREKLGVTLV